MDAVKGVDLRPIVPRPRAERVCGRGGMLMA